MAYAGSPHLAIVSSERYVDGGQGVGEKMSNDKNDEVGPRRECV